MGRARRRWRHENIVAAGALMPTVMHLMPLSNWVALGPDEPVSNPSLAAEGFIHCTDEAAVLLQVANAFYASLPGDFIALYIDTTLLTSDCIWESPASINGSAEAFAPLFPHVYGPIDRVAVVAIAGLVRESDGRFVGYLPAVPST